MLFLLPVCMLFLLLDAPAVMRAVSGSCALFVGSVMPGLFPYMVLSLMLVSRLPGTVPDWLLVVVGWCGGSPVGARLLRERGGMPAWRRRRIAVCCATMSPMFLLGTVPQWLGNSRCGPCLLFSVVLGGMLAGLLVRPASDTAGHSAAQPARPLPFGEAVEAAARTMLLVCGTMAMLRVAADGAGRLLSGMHGVRLAAVTLLEVTCGTKTLAELCLPLALRTALIAGATGFGGAAILMQNRAVLPTGVLTLPQQAWYQAMHALFSFLIAYGWMLMAGA